MNKADTIRIRHMLDAANEILSFMGGISQKDFNQDRQLVLAIIKDIEIIGEAAKKLSKEFMALNPQVPWVDIVGMRNHLIHEYFDVDLNIVWKTATQDIPLLLEKLKPLLDNS